MTYRIEAACISCCGQREKNEDNFLFDGKRLAAPNQGMDGLLMVEKEIKEPFMMAVFDGMGGGSMGDLAAATAAESFRKRMEQSRYYLEAPERLLKKLCIVTERAIISQRESIMARTMGCTMAALYLTREKIYACNLGDSRLYRLRGGLMTQLSTDHTDERLIREMGINRQPQLLQYLGMSGDGMEPNPCIQMGSYRQGDWYFLCTDGVEECLSPKILHEKVLHTGNPELLAEQVLPVLQKSQDNATMIALKIG